MRVQQAALETFDHCRPHHRARPAYARRSAIELSRENLVSRDSSDFFWPRGPPAVGTMVRGACAPERSPHEADQPERVTWRGKPTRPDPTTKVARQIARPSACFLCMTQANSLRPRRHQRILTTAETTARPQIRSSAGICRTRTSVVIDRVQSSGNPEQHNFEIFDARLLFAVQRQRTVNYSNH